MAQTIENDGVPPVTGVQRRVPRLPQQVLGVLHRCAQAEAYAQQAVAGGEAASGEQLVQIYLADTGLLGQRGLGEAGGGVSCSGVSRKFSLFSDRKRSRLLLLGKFKYMWVYLK